jgi:hypothetical protein
MRAAPPEMGRGGLRRCRGAVPAGAPPEMALEALVALRGVGESSRGLVKGFKAFVHRGESPPEMGKEERFAVAAGEKGRRRWCCSV